MSQDVMTITPLGSGQEVGRSCHLLEFRGLTIMLDCGIHPGYEGMNGLPFFDHVDPAKVDVLLITHFHLDHAASLPYFTERTSFKGRIFMTHPTKAVIRLLLGDYLRLMSIKDDDVLYTEQDLQNCCDKVELVDYHQVVSLFGGRLKFIAYNAGHVLGAAMFYLDVGGRTVLYTGDYSMEDDRHLMAAEIPTQLLQESSPQLDVLMVESTYGVQVHASRAEREARFTGTVERVVARGGKCLIPVFALGRAQELLLILDEYWQANPQLQSIPIWYASKLASRALRVYQTYANMMNARIRAQMGISNPFKFRYISNLKSIDVNSFDDRGASVVFASPGMLQSGVSRQLFDRWCTDSKNGVLIAGYAVEHTLAKEIMNQPKEVVSLEGRRQPLNALVDYVSFSAHVDFMQNRNFIGQTNPRHIVLVHGQKDEMGRLKSALMLLNRQKPEAKRPTITMPPNLQPVQLSFSRRRSAKVMGTLAQEGQLVKGQSLKGIMVTQNFQSKIVASQDLSKYTQLRVGSISSKLHVPYCGKVETIRLFLGQMFAHVNETINESNCTVFEIDAVRLTYNNNGGGVVTVEWDATPVADLLADSVIALLMHAQSSPASIRLTSQPCSHSRRPGSPSSKKPKPLPLLEGIQTLLEQQFDVYETKINHPTATYTIHTDTGLEVALGEGQEYMVTTVKVDLNLTGAKVAVQSDDSKLATNIRDCIQSFLKAASPIVISTANTTSSTIEK